MKRLTKVDQLASDRNRTKTSPITPCSFLVPNKWYLHMTDELDGEASAFVLGRSQVDVCVQGAADFPFHPNLHRNISGFLGGDKPVFGSLPDHYATALFS